MATINDELKIENKIPLPRIGATKSARRFPLGKLKVGDSFLVPAKNHSEMILERSAVAQACSQWKRRHAGWDYTSRTVSDGIRVWRTA